MAITETFEDVAREYTTNSLPTRIPNRDGLAMERMWTLADNMSHTKHLPYARGSWGYTSTSFLPLHLNTRLIVFSFSDCIY